MRDDLHGEDLRTIWQSQHTEPSTMTLEKIRIKARELHRKTSRELLASISLAVIVVGVSSAGILFARDPALRLMFALAIAWTFGGQLLLHRGMWSRTPPGDAALSTGVEFYRHEIKRQRYVFGRVVQWSFGPLVLSTLGAILAMMGIAKNRGLSINAVMPFCTLFGLWIVAVFVLRWRSQRALQREANALDNIER